MASTPVLSWLLLAFFALAPQARAASTTTLTSDFSAQSLTISGDGRFNANGWNVTVATDVAVAGGGTLDAATAYPGAAGKPSLFTVGGNWTLLQFSAVFAAADSTVAFVSSGSSQTVNARGQAFNVLIASNTSTGGGLLFASSFSAANFTASALPAASTITFTANSTATITSLTLTGAPLSLIALRSSLGGVWTYLNDTGSNAVSFVDVKDNNAASGLTILAGSSSSDGGHNVNWEFGAALYAGGDGDQYAAGLGGNAGTATIDSSSQTLYVGDPATAISTITITQFVVGGSSGNITTGNDIRIRIPAGLFMSWDTSDTSAILGGSAAGKVSATVSYADAGATLVLAVTGDFVQGDVLTVGGLSFANFSGAALGTLELDVDNGAVSAVDAGVKTIRLPDSQAVFTGGDGDQYATGQGSSAGPLKTWWGGLDANWSLGDNWDAGVPPGPSEAALIVSTATNMPTLTADIAISTLTINAGTATLTLNGYNLTLSSFTNGGNLIFKGTETVTTAPGNLAGSTVTYNATSGTVLILSTWTYRNLVINGSGGTFTPQAALSVAENLVVSSGTLDTTASNWSVNVSSSVTLTGGTFNLNASTMTVARNFERVTCNFNAGTSLALFSGAAAQNVRSSSAAYHRIQVANAAGVTFRDSLTVATFTATTPNALIKFQTAPSSVTVTGYLNLNGQATGTRVRLESAVPGTRAPILLASGITQSVLNASIRDSSASLVGVTGDASDPSNLDNGNNFNWNFPMARYWVKASGTGNWSDAANWSQTSGGAGGASVPTNGQQAVFDGNGPGNCLIDQPVSIGNLTLSTSSGAGWNGAIDTSSSTVTVSSITMNFGTFYARTSSITINGSVTIASGTFNANGSTITASGNLSVTGGVCNGQVSVMTVNGAFTLASPGHFTAPASLLTVGGTFSAAAGTFTEAGTVYFSGSSTLSANGQSLGDVILGP